MSVTEVMPVEAPPSSADLQSRANFRIALRGYDRDEVRETFERMTARHQALSMKNISLQAQIAKLESKVAAYQLEENTFRGAVLMLQKQYDEARQRGTDAIKQAVDQARAEALRQASAEADQLLARAQERALKVERCVWQLNDHQERFNAVLRHTIEQLQGLMSGATAQPASVEAVRVPAAGTVTPTRPEREPETRPPAPAVAPGGRVTAALAAGGTPSPERDAAIPDTIATVEQIEAMLKGIDGAIVDIPALPAE
jgi:cell division septum initiation protein DivIVA